MEIYPQKRKIMPINKKACMEIRSFSEEKAMPTVVNERTIEGYSTVFNKESRILFDPQKKRFFIEIIRSTAVNEADLRNWDIKALMEHDKSRLLARSFNGSGTLQLSVDDYGVNYRFEAPETTEGNNALVHVKRRDIFGSSFAYTANERDHVTYTKRSDGILIREVHRLKRMFDISLVSDPAYFGTDVNVRSLDYYFEELPDESYKQDVADLRSLIY